MEKNQKRKGFMKRLYRAARSAGKLAKTKQSYLPPPASTSSLDNSFAVSSEMRSTSYPNRSTAVQKQASLAHDDENGGKRGAYGGGDENVDIKAAMYILWVRERLKMERSLSRVNSEIRVQKM